MSFGKLGALGRGFGGLGSALGGPGNRPFGAAFSATVNFAGDIRQSNLVGAAFSGVAALAGDISLSAGVQIGTAITTTISFVADVRQANLVGAALGGSASFAGDVAVTAATSSRGYFAGDIEPGLYPEQLYGRDLALLSSAAPETFAMQ